MGSPDWGHGRHLVVVVVVVGVWAPGSMCNLLEVGREGSDKPITLRALNLGARGRIRICSLEARIRNGAEENGNSLGQRAGGMECWPVNTLAIPMSIFKSS